MKHIITKREGSIHIGLRMIKSAIAVWICYLVYFLRGRQGIPFYSAIAAILCMQTYKGNSKQVALNRIIGTMIGAFYGSIVLAIKFTFFSDLEESLIYYSILSGIIILVIFTSVEMKKSQVAYFSCVVFLSIASNHVLDEYPFIFVIDRVLDTLIGIVVSLGVNLIRIPTKKQKDILFISGIDDTLLMKDDKITPYSKVELNRLISEGANFTVATERTPASVMEALKDIQFKLPIIAMNGAVLYDIRDRRFIHSFPVKYHIIKQVIDVLEKERVGYFANVLIQDILLIYFNKFTNHTMEDIRLRLRKSPYRNYIQGEVPKEQDVLYLYIVEKTETIRHLEGVLKAQPFISEIQVYISDYKLREGYSYIKVYSLEASRANMIDYLQNKLELDKRITFGSIEGKSDFVMHQGDGDTVVRTIKRHYELYFWEN